MMDHPSFGMPRSSFNEQNLTTEGQYINKKGPDTFTSMHEHEHLLSDRRLWAAIALNLLLTVAEVLGGMLSGSLALLADAVHNFSDVGSLLIALLARRIARRQADEKRTFGYGRAEVIGALINLTALVLVATYLLYEAGDRYFNPQQIDGWTVLGIALIALVVDVGTAGLLFTMSRGNLNVRAAFLHNLSDALASVGVIVVAIAVLLWQFFLADVLITLAISAYILWQSLGMMRKSIAILMQSAPDDINLDDLVETVQTIDGVRAMHHIHVWQIDEHECSLEAHVVIEDHDFHRLEEVKTIIKNCLADSFGIRHATLEFELPRIAEHPDHDDSRISRHL